MYVSVKDLPPAVVKALDGVGYGRTDIEVKAGTTVTLGSSGGKGKRSFVSLVNLSTGEARTEYGSWGGPNMFDRSNRVDNDHQSYPLPSNGVAITGSSGGGHPVWAQLHVPATMVDRMLPAAGETLTDEEQDALYCYKAIKGGQYRTDALRRLHVHPATVDSLVERGYLERNRAGATKITTKGKNAFDGTRGGQRGY
jgi:hypothetical protein